LLRCDTAALGAVKVSIKTDDDGIVLLRRDVHQSPRQPNALCWSSTDVYWPR